MPLAFLLLALLQATPRQEVLEQMRLRPRDAWPRGRGHVVLAWPGSREQDKAYHEPGGSFSPAVGSFGVAVWVDGGAAGDTIPLEQIRQSLFWPPGVLTETPYYEAAWASPKPGAWTLRLSASESPRPVALAVRSVGPAGGALRTLDWNGRRLLLNGRWRLRLDPSPAGVHLGEEGAPGWRKEAGGAAHLEAASGWGWARLDLPSPRELPGAPLNPDPAAPYTWTLTIADGAAPPAPARRDLRALDVVLPDARFQACLNAQIAHLLMGLVDDQTRPGDPVNYPLAWLRDGAYVVAALARAGQLDTARRLSRYFAEHDFFGGFGAEADAPGLALWALEEVAVRVKSADFDHSLWPAVRRKAGLILELLSATAPVEHEFAGPVVPRHRGRTDLNLVAEPARGGLIAGRMDHHRPLLFVNAASYGGLVAAAGIAERLGHAAEARAWRAAAASLRAAWERAFEPPESGNDRTWICGLWPTGVASGLAERYRQGLEERWGRLRNGQGGFRRTPEWTYFDLAEAHQWLALGNATRAFATLKWFWEHQASPGLYTWWEGSGEENSFGGWEQVRGWVQPPYVTPHYWTAAEMLLLQLDALALAGPAAGEITLGAGLPPEWRAKPMSVRGLVTPYGPLDWSWDGKRMKVTLKGKGVKVRLDGAFPAEAPVEIAGGL